MKPAVLLLDDDERDLMLLEQILHPDGFQVLKTTDPARAFELLASHPVRIVISDQNMPGITGGEFLSQVRKLYPDVIRIVFTNSQDPKVFADAVNEAGIHKLIMKDWDREAFASTFIASRSSRPPKLCASTVRALTKMKFLK